MVRPQGGFVVNDNFLGFLRIVSVDILKSQFIFHKKPRIRGTHLYANY